MAEAAGFVVQYDDEYYRILGPGGQEGEVSDIGSPAFLNVGGQVYIAFLDLDPDGEEGEAPDPSAQTWPVAPTVYLLGTPQMTRFEETVFEGPGLHEDEDEGDDEPADDAGEVEIEDE